MAFSPQFLDEIRARLTLSDIIGRSVKLTRKGREHTGLCPFHNEKTPSFTVSDDKNFYHCFGCGAHGDVISYVIENDGLSFPDAVERLAAEAGLEVPASTPQEREREQRRAELVDVVEAACLFYESTLWGGAGRQGLALPLACGQGGGGHVEEASLAPPGRGRRRPWLLLWLGGSRPRRHGRGRPAVTDGWGEERREVRWQPGAGGGEWATGCQGEDAPIERTCSSAPGEDDDSGPSRPSDSDDAGSASSNSTTTSCRGNSAAEWRCIM